MTPQDRTIGRAVGRVRNPLTAIRAFCVTCMGGYVNLIPACPAAKCPLYAYRFGKNPKARKRGRPFKIAQSTVSSPANSAILDPPGPGDIPVLETVGGMEDV